MCMPPRRPDFQPIPLRTRWEAKVQRTAECWEWTGARSSTGYGVIQRGGVGPKKLLFAHRLAYEFYVGPIPDGLHIDHLCRNRGCVRPDHLEAVTVRENILRGTGWMAERARATHCVHGHEFTPENTYLYGPTKTWRMCVACSRARTRSYQRAS